MLAGMSGLPQANWFRLVSVCTSQNAGRLSTGYSNSMQLLLAAWCWLFPAAVAVHRHQLLPKSLHEGVQMLGGFARRLGCITTGSAQAVFMGTPGQPSAALPSV